MKLKRKKVFFYNIFTDRILLDLPSAKPPGGANLQLAFWAYEFSHVFRTYTFAQLSSYFLISKKFNIHFVYLPFSPRFLRAIFLKLKHLTLLFIRPEVVIIRGDISNISLLIKMQRILNFHLVLMLASDNDTFSMQKFLNLNGGYNNFINRFSLIVVQNNYQYEQMKSMGFVPILIRNLFNPQILLNNKLLPTRDNYTFDFIWISNIRPVKNIQLLFRISRLLPNKKFCVIGGISDECSNIIQEFGYYSNLAYLGPKTPTEVLKYVFMSKFLVCTSTVEGFPNNFLFAWFAGVPTLSTVDPDGLIDQFNLGFVFSDENDFLDKFRKINDEIAYKSFTTCITNFFQNNYMNSQQAQIQFFTNAIINL